MFQLFILSFLILYFCLIIYLILNLNFTYENRVLFDDRAKILYFDIDDTVDLLLLNNKIEKESIK